MVVNAASWGVAFEFGAFEAWFFLSLVSWVKGFAVPTLWFLLVGFLPSSEK